MTRTRGRADPEDLEASGRERVVRLEVEEDLVAEGRDGSGDPVAAEPAQEGGGR